MNSHELLSKAAVIREYGFPEHQLDADLRSGKIAHFRSGYDFDLGDGKTAFIGSRYYIKRESVEQRIDELTKAKESAS